MDSISIVDVKTIIDVKIATGIKKATVIKKKLSRYFWTIALYKKISRDSSYQE